ncbi:DUF4262 domain-containing protein [Massilia sp.]|uniref:DUF4262 domain-containing protein n=1 Tax=Massilia sp. TaxID=1882437 RepID=UPI00352C4056
MVRKVGEDSPEQKVIDNIAEYGWHCVRILEDADLPGYAFTIGNFQSYKHPEFIIFGLPSEVAHQVLNLAVSGLNKGAIFDLSVPTDELLNGYPCVFVEVPESEYREHVGFCRWYYEGNNFPLYQIVWPSRDGKFPWHVEASDSFRARQPVLGHSQQGL